MINLESCVLSDGIKKLIPILQTVCLTNVYFQCKRLTYLTSIFKKLEKLEVFRIFFHEFEAVGWLSV